jgi:hypothetical protein
LIRRRGRPAGGGGGIAIINDRVIFASRRKSNMPEEFSSEEKQQIIENLERFPELNQIIERNNVFFRRYNAREYQYSRDNETDDNNLEFTLANTLKNIHYPKLFRRIQRLEQMLSRIPQQAKRKFGNKLIQPDFLSTLSEIEVYYNLILHDIEPEIEPRISANENTVDFRFIRNRRAFDVEVKTPRQSQRFSDYINSLHSHDLDPDLHVGVGSIDRENQLYIDASDLNSNSDSRSYPRESSRIANLIFEEFIGRNLRNIDNSLSNPIILIINMEYAYSSISFYFDTLELLDELMRENPPTEFQGILIYPRLPFEEIQYFFPNPNFGFLPEEIQFFSSLIRN